MNATQQRIKIAEACGWTAISIYPDGTAMAFDPSKILRAKLPDYLNDLNAMHEAEKVLTKRQWPKYQGWISAIFSDNPALDFAYETHATAAQRAEAFLRCLGKWEQ